MEYVSLKREINRQKRDTPKFSNYSGQALQLYYPLKESIFQVLKLFPLAALKRLFDKSLGKQQNIR